jgi:uridine kinase
MIGDRHTFAIFVAMYRGAYLVGIAGGSGSGKTSLVRALRDSLPHGTVCLVSQDDYYHPQDRQHCDENGRLNYDLPGAVDLDALASDLRALATGEPVYRREYTFNQEGREAGLIELRPAKVILVEGLFVLHHGPVRELFDLRVFIEASEDVQLQRRLIRDSRDRGYGHDEVMYQWDNHVLPAYRQYLLPYRDLCDLHVVNESSFDRAMKVLHDHLLQVAGQVEPIVLQDLQDPIR